MKTSITHFAGLFLIPIALFSLGCSGSSSDQPDLGVVSGIVTLKGKPLPKVEVRFTPKEGRPSVGTTDAEGKYELFYIRDTKGAKIGTHQVRITTIHETASDKESGKAPKETIPSIYNSKTTLTEEVAAGENTIDFPLK